VEEQPGSLLRCLIAEHKHLDDARFDSGYPDHISGIHLKGFQLDSRFSIIYFVYFSVFYVGGLATGSHPIPFRTRKLSLSAPMVVVKARVGRRQHKVLKNNLNACSLKNASVFLFSTVIILEQYEILFYSAWAK
jgi:hypothetical protein